MFKYLTLSLWLICFVNLANAADMVVIHDSHQLFHKGQLLDSEKPLDIPQNVELTVVFSNGEVTTLKGPYHGKVKTPSVSKESADNQLITALSSFLKEMPVVNRAAKQEKPDNLWLVDVSAEPDKRYYCVGRSGPVTLWRPSNDSNTASFLLIKHKASGKEAQLTWPAHQSTISWPATLPIVYGSTYTLEVTSTQDGRSSFKKLVLHQLPDALPTPSHKVVWMVGKGCIPQANMLLASIR
jgi:hypothetical protein